MRTLVPALLLLVATLYVSGCGTVRPWQREQLTKMQKSSERFQTARSYEAHFWMVREAAVGGTGKPAGGCGCN